MNRRIEMSEIGEYLKSERLKKGYSIEDIQEMTKIRTRYIQAIETGNYDILPGKFYARAFIKNYAEVLDLNTNDIISELERELPLEIEYEIPQNPRKNNIIKKPNIMFFNFSHKIIIFLFVSIIVFFIYQFIVTNYSKNNENLTTPSPPEINFNNQLINNENKPTTNTTDDASKTDIIKNVIITKLNSTYTGKTLTDNYVIKNANSINLVISAVKGDCWFELKDENNKIIETGIIKKGNKKDWRLTKKAIIKFGALNNLEVSVNNNKLPSDNLDVKILTFILE